MKGKIIGYRFGGTAEQYIVPVTESDDPVEAAKQKQYIESFPEAGQVVDMIRALDLKDAAAATPDSATEGGSALQLTIEEKIESLAPNACRGCAHFMRVNFDNVSNVTNRQGFCILGQLEGDWGLYVSSSISTRCAGFLYSEEHAKIHDAERQLSDDQYEFIHSLYDKRTANHRAIKPLLDARNKLSGKGQRDDAWMHNELNVRKLGNDYFQKMHHDRYWEVYRMVSLKKTHYMRFLAGVSVRIHDQFCGCGKIEMIPEKEETR